MNTQTPRLKPAAAAAAARLAARIPASAWFSKRDRHLSLAQAFAQEYRVRVITSDVLFASLPEDFTPINVYVSFGIVGTEQFKLERLQRGHNDDSDPIVKVLRNNGDVLYSIPAFEQRPLRILQPL